VKIKETLLNWIKFLYEKFFGMEFTDEIRTLINNIYYVFIGTTFSSIFLFIIHVYGGRVVGPEQYGLFNLMVSISLFLAIPTTLGMEIATQKYLPSNRDVKERKKIISSSYFIIFILLIILLPVYLLISAYVSSPIRISIELFYLAIIFSILYTLYKTSTGIMRGLLSMKRYSIFEILSSFIAFILFFYLISICMERGFSALYLPFGIKYLVVFFLVLLYVKHYLSSKIDFSWSKKLVHYGSIAAIGDVAWVLVGNIDRIMINMFLDTSSVGIYQAYYFASTVPIGAIWGVFRFVLFPTFSKFEDKKSILFRIEKLIPLCFLILLILTPIVTFIILCLYGTSYKIDFLLIILFTFFTAIAHISAMYSWLLNSIGVGGVKVVTMSTYLLAGVNIILNLILIPNIGLFGAVMASVISKSAVLVYYLYTIYLKKSFTELV